MGGVPINFLDNYIADMIFGLISGISSSLGLGGGAILIFYLTKIIKIEQLKAQEINLIFIIPVALISTFVYSREKIINFNLIFKIAIFGIFGALFGSFLLKFINPLFLRKILGIFFIITSMFLFFGKRKKS